MTMLSDWLALDRLAALALAVLWLEVLLLCAFAPHPFLRLRALFANALSGSALLAALMLVAPDGTGLAPVALLALAGLAHGMDIWQRLRNQTRRLSRRTE